MARKRTQQEFEDLINMLGNGEYQVIGKYVNNNTHIEIIHAKCNRIWNVIPHDFITAHSRCPYCQNSYTKSDKEFRQKVKNLVGAEYSVMTKYINSSTKVTLRHNVCHQTYEVKPIEFTGTHQRRCPYCAGNKKKTDSEFLIEIQALVGNDYKVLSKYKNNHTKIKFQHSRCGHEFLMYPKDFLSGQRCPFCMGAHRMDHQEFIDTVFNLVQDEYSVIGKFINSHKKIEMIHVKCGHHFNAIPKDFIHRGIRCPYCFGNMKKSTEQFKDEVNKLTDGQFAVIGSYVNSKSKILIKHNICKKSFEITPNDFLRHKNCPCCNQSIGEQLISSFLLKHYINYDRQYKFKDCVYKSELPFDFVVFNDSKLSFLIEYDGEGHYKPIDWSGKGQLWAEQNLKEYQYRDSIKTKYCKDHNINLLRIPYWDFDNIEKILSNELIKYKLIK